MATKKRRLILAYPRSGTRYIQKVAEAHGLKFGHEGREDCTDGMVSYKHLDKTDEFDIVLHQVRHPLSVISSSLAIVYDDVFRNMEAVTGRKFRSRNRIIKLMETWLVFNDMAEKVACLTYRIEDFESIYYAWGRDMQLEEIHSQPPLHINKNINSARHPNLSWNDLRYISAEVAEQIYEKSQLYGYKNGI
jgi:hypothetical protein